MDTRLATLTRALLVGACLSLGFARAASAQMTVAPAPDSVQFLPRYDFTLSAAALGYDDDRFSWDTHWAGDFDMIDYGRGRVTFLTDLQGLLGSEFRPFDPYQSNYLLEASSSVRAGRVEFVGVLNHVSRHLGDRFKRVAVAENSLGVRVLTRVVPSESSSLDIRVDVRKVIARAYVDYNWIGVLDLTARRQVAPHAGVYGRVMGDGIPVVADIANRATQYGGRAEVGVRFTGNRGALDLFGGFERLTDADLLDRQPRRWAFFGFRVVGR